MTTVKYKRRLICYIEFQCHRLYRFFIMNKMWDFLKVSESENKCQNATLLSEIERQFMEDFFEECYESSSQHKKGSFGVRTRPIHEPD